MTPPDDSDSPRQFPRASTEQKLLFRQLDRLEAQNDRLEAQNEKQTGVLEEVRAEVAEIRLEVAATYSKKEDCLARDREERILTGEGFKRVWDEGFPAVAARAKAQDERLDRHSQRITALEGDKREHTGAHKVIKTQTRWVLGIVGAVVTAAGIAAASWLVRGCVGS